MAQKQRRDVLKGREKVAKGFANHRRIEIMELLSRRGEMTLWQIQKVLGVGMTTASEHTRRLVAGGQVWKRYEGKRVLHTLTPLGKKCLKFLRTLDN